MAQGSSPMPHLIRRLVGDPGVRCCPDGELLQRFLGRQDEAAFEALVRRHGPLVVDVCRGVLFNESDVEDAFQATFLLLARKAGSIRTTGSLASWLHGVAYRMACKARTDFARRRRHEGAAPGGPAVRPANPVWDEVRHVVHEELNAISERHRVPLVLCYLEGKTQDEAAAALGLSKGTLKRRLERGRALLRMRLVRRGLGATAVLLVSAWPTVVSAGVATPLVLSTVKAAITVAAGGAVAATASAKVAALVNGGLNAMTFTKLKVAAVVLVGLAALGTTAVGLARQQQEGPENPQARIDDPQTPPSEEEKAKAKVADETAAVERAQEAAKKALAARQDGKAPKGGAGKGDAEALRGTWTAASGETEGRAIPADAVKAYRLTFADGKVTVQIAGKGKEGTFKLDPAATPKAIDLDLDGGAGVGIYSLDGDTLKLCFIESGKGDRPTRFSTEEKSRRILLVLKKAGDAKKGEAAKPSGGKKEEADDEGDLPQVKVSKEKLKALERENAGLKAAVNRSREELDVVLTKVDAEKKTISFTLKGTKLAVESVPVKGDAELVVGDGKVALGDLKAGTAASLRVNSDGERPVVTAIRAAKPGDK